MNDSSDTRDRRERLGVFCYYMIPALSMKWVVSFMISLGLVVNVHCKLTTSLKEKKTNCYAKKGEKMESCKMFN